MELLLTLIYLVLILSASIGISVGLWLVLDSAVQLLKGIL